RRSAPYPSFMNFDATDRSLCVVRRPLTNTPQQALTLMNDPVYLEAARALAGRIVAEAPDKTVEKRVEFAWRLCVSRQATAREASLLRDTYLQELKRAEAKASAKIRVGGAKTAEEEAWFYVATVLLNLDETITKG